MTVSNVCVDGMKIELSSTPATWSWGETYEAAGNSVEVTISATPTFLRVNDSSCVLLSNITSTMTLYANSYCAAGYGPHAGGAFGTILAVTLITVVPSVKLFTNSNGVILDNISGTFTAVVSFPATNGVPSNDTVLVKNGTFNISDHGQGTPIKLTEES